VALKISESAGLHATIAAQVAVAEAGAVDKLLLGEGKKLASGLVVSALESTGGGEGPA